MASISGPFSTRALSRALPPVPDSPSVRWSRSPQNTAVYSQVQRLTGLGTPAVQVVEEEVPPPLPPKLRHAPPLLQSRPAVALPGATLASMAAHIDDGLPEAPGPAPPLQTVLPNGHRQPRLVAAPYSHAEMSRAHETLKQALPHKCNRKIRIGQDREYRVMVGVGRVITIEAIHRPGTDLLIAPGGAMWFAGQRVMPSTDAPTRRQVAERINVVGRLVEALRERHAASSVAAHADPSDDS